MESKLPFYKTEEYVKMKKYFLSPPSDTKTTNEQGMIPKWICRNCGYTQKAEKSSRRCPMCSMYYVYSL